MAGKVARILRLSDFQDKHQVQRKKKKKNKFELPCVDPVEARRFFHDVDGDLDGFITAEDLQQFICKRKLERVFPNEMVTGMVREADLDRDGKLNLSELTLAMSGRFRYRQHSVDWVQLALQAYGPHVVVPPKPAEPQGPVVAQFERLTSAAINRRLFRPDLSLTDSYRNSVRPRPGELRARSPDSLLEELEESIEGRESARGAGSRISSGRGCDTSFWNAYEKSKFFNRTTAPTTNHPSPSSISEALINSLLIPSLPPLPSSSQPLDPPLPLPSLHFPSDPGGIQSEPSTGRFASKESVADDSESMRWFPKMGQPLLDSLVSPRTDYSASTLAASNAPQPIVHAPTFSFPARNAFNHTMHQAKVRSQEQELTRRHGWQGAPLGPDPDLYDSPSVATDELRGLGRLLGVFPRLYPHISSSRSTQPLLIVLEGGKDEDEVAGGEVEFVTRFRTPDAQQLKSHVAAAKRQMRSPYHTPDIPAFRPDSQSRSIAQQFERYAQHCALSSVPRSADAARPQQDPNSRKASTIMSGGPPPVTVTAPHTLPAPPSGNARHLPPLS